MKLNLKVISDEAVVEIFHIFYDDAVSIPDSDNKNKKERNEEGENAFCDNAVSSNDSEIKNEKERYEEGEIDRYYNVGENNHIKRILRLDNNGLDAEAL